MTVTMGESMKQTTWRIVGAIFFGGAAIGVCWLFGFGLFS
jgi:hypothetical protein